MFLKPCYLRDFLSDDYVRVRVYIKSNRSTKNIVLVRKQAEWKEKWKIDRIILKEEFDTEKEAFDFIDENLSSEFEKGFEYSRKGWQYELDGCQIFIEDIKGYRPTVEIEANDEKELEDLFNEIEVLEILKESVPKTMRKILKD